MRSLDLNWMRIDSFFLCVLYHTAWLLASAMQLYSSSLLKPPYPTIKFSLNPLFTFVYPSQSYCHNIVKEEIDMGQSLKKLAPGSEENKAKEIGPVIENCYNTYFAGTDKHVHRDWKSDDFYHAVCETIEEINKTLGSTQFRVPKTTELEQVFKIHHKGEDKVTKEEFNKILQDLVFKTRFSGFGAKDMLIYIFGVPMTTLFIKQKIIPKVIPNEIFIPVVTSATVFVLAKLNKI